MLRDQARNDAQIGCWALLPNLHENACPVLRPVGVHVRQEIFAEPIARASGAAGSATIIGIVGAGGIGANLYEEIQQNEWPQVAFLVLMILLTVAVIDLISSRLRAAVIGTSKSESGR
jgi:hypothetical protein